MAGGQPLIPPTLRAARLVPLRLGLGLGTLLLGLVGLSIGVLFWQGSREAGGLGALAAGLFGPEARFALRAALLQASLSTVLSVGLGLWLARALVRRGAFWGRRALLSLSWLAMVVPTSVAALAILSVWGPAGSGRMLAERIGLPLPFEQFGLGMVLLAHCFFNVPLAMRLGLSALSSLPDRQWQLGASLGLSARDYFIWMEWPVLRLAAIGSASLIFLLCFTSFALVLMLGGGPRVTTLEVAIYTALRFDFDLPLAAGLALLQLLVCAGLLLLLWYQRAPLLNQGAAGLPGWPRRDRAAWLARFGDWLAIGLLVLLVVLPLLSLLAGQDWQAGANLFTRPVFWQALLDTALVCLPSAVISLGLGLIFATALVRARQTGQRLAGRFIGFSISASLMLPALVLGTALFILLYQLAPPARLAWGLVLLANILLSLPFVMRLLEPRLAWLLPAQDRLADQLGLSGWRRLRVTLPALGDELQTGFALAAALSLGDLGVIALFGSADFQTLPWLLYQYQNRYGGAEAEMLALVMLGLVLLLFFTAGRLTRPAGGGR
jgi:thiamine transport system permease protein